jgi:[ribosomal protein S5]-alanine N-acetyltransferase
VQVSVRFPDDVPVLIETPHAVHLRPHADQDVAAIVEQCRDPEVMAWTSVPLDYDEAAARAYLAGAAANWEAGRPQWAIEAVRDGRRAYCGSINLRPHDDGSAEVAYALHPGARGRGYASSALRLVRDYGFDVLGLPVLRWHAAVGNWASRRTAAAAGFVIDGTVRGLLNQRGVWLDGWVATMLRDDPRIPQPWLDPPELTGSGLRLRPLSPADAPRIVEACTDPRTRRWLVSLPDPYGAAAALAFVEQAREAAASGLGWSWCVTASDEDRLLGSVSLEGFYGYSRRAEMGYWAHPDARGHGVLTRAVRLVTEHAEETGLTSSIQIRCAAGNTASRHVAKEAGYREVGTMIAAEPVGSGELMDLIIYARP